MRDPIKGKAYLTALLRLPDLVSGAEGLPSNQSAAYYSCVLASGSLQTVPQNLPAKRYKQLAASFVGGSPPALAMEPAAPNASGVFFEFPDAVISGDEDVVAKKASSKRSTVDSDETDWAVLAGLHKRQRLGPPLPQRGSGSASSSHKRGRGQDPASPDVPPEIANSSLRTTNDQYWMLSIVLEDHVLKYDEWGVRGQAGHYIRWKVTCRCNGKEHVKTRSLSENYGRETGLGQLEPFAYLGQWIRGHKAKLPSQYKPSIEETVAYARDNLGWTGQ